MRNTSTRHFHEDRSATSAIEFAIVAPVFILLLMGMLAYGIYFGASHSVQQIAADAARAAVAGLSETERRTIVADYVTDNASGYPLIDAEKLSVTTVDAASGDGEFTVTIRYDASDLPIWSLFEPLALPHTTIQRRSVIRMGGI